MFGVSLNSVARKMGGFRPFKLCLFPLVPKIGSSLVSSDGLVEGYSNKHLGPRPFVGCTIRPFGVRRASP